MKTEKKDHVIIRELTAKEQCLEKENVEKDTEIKDLTSRMDEFDQETRKDNLLISGISEVLLMWRREWEYKSRE